MGRYAFYDTELTVSIPAGSTEVAGPSTVAITVLSGP
jgi:hypothetical protein